ncbi:sulfotransferase domain-containing protein [Desulfovibrio ferrophilus]|uniref:Sulfotransferase domain-containing protein n=1 Tax=Desulfovibrio ferrophilus TaxID=241368 RepID=A0A2Z6B1B3_9BACT|nr:sulfotransferase domain-containing protein [Desulfovibrio ferrophilus]BBD09309.1 putative uncharacterized protein [Desulfovibrio ferrophilus]
MKKVLVYTIHKAASMFIHKINDEIARFLGVIPCSINGDDFKTEIREKSWKTIIETRNECAVFGPIRIGEALPNIPDIPEDHSIIFHARDPRDVLTSLFFSAAYSHPIKKNVFEPSEQTRLQWINEGIDSFVLGYTKAWTKRYETIIELHQNLKHCNLVKYEDMVLNYDRWLMQYLMSFKHLAPGEDIRPLFTHCLVAFKDEFKIVPEDVHRHKRKMVPGDYKEKLAPETIATLNTVFAPALEYFQYSQ